MRTLIVLVLGLVLLGAIVVGAERAPITATAVGTSTASRLRSRERADVIPRGNDNH
jgi:hypothetical protein